MDSKMKKMEMVGRESVSSVGREQIVLVFYG